MQRVFLFLYFLRVSVFPNGAALVGDANEHCSSLECCRSKQSISVVLNKDTGL